VARQFFESAFRAIITNIPLIFLWRLRRLEDGGAHSGRDRGCGSRRVAGARKDSAGFAHRSATCVHADKLNFHAFNGSTGRFWVAARIQPRPCANFRHPVRQKLWFALGFFRRQKILWETSESGL